MQCETQCLASLTCMLLFSDHKTTTTTRGRPLGVTLYHVPYVCMSRKAARKRVTSVGNMQNPSGWYHGDCLTKRDWEEDDKFRKEPVESRLTAGCGVSSTVARSTWQNARPERRWLDVPLPCASNTWTFDWSPVGM